ncbi:metalloprotease mig-17-like isoform X2 [Mercenaria mercenaria]|uniref:metalloprotease mig-17-like isoform X2 n=1 Tax=Mercenaria mercenaria TaxID=6596 RepID=UPI001E1DDAA8|nr:metalloprotease mig-17-like isoform X2 [Mercenaria mercenaria]
MELRDQLMLFVCILVPTVYCGKIKDYFRVNYLDDPYRGPPFQTYWRHKNTMVEFEQNETSSNTLYRFRNTADRPVNRSSLLALLQVAVIQRDMQRDIFSTSPYTPSYVTDSHPFIGLSKRHYMKHTDTTIELLLVIDNSTFQKFLRETMFDIDDARKRIKQYFSILIAIVNQRFETITDKTYSIHVQICDIYIAETKRDVVWLEYIARWSAYNGNSIVSASRALKRFQKWLRRNSSLPKYDHAILLTSYILKRRLKKVDGLAFVGTMCDTVEGKSSSIVQDIGDFKSAGVITHELGHSLGATHDGEGINKICPADKNYIMAPQNAHEQNVSRNVFYFSQCSMRQLKHFIMSSKAKCLLNVPRDTTSHDLIKKPPGKMFDKNDQCRMAFGSSSMFCEIESARSMICSRLWCTSDMENKCHSNNRLMALPGTPCGQGKFCHLGECVSPYRQSIAYKMYNRTPTMRDGVCPAGDFNTIYCSVIIKASPRLCEERKGMKKTCCQSCRDRRNLAFSLS